MYCTRRARESGFTLVEVAVIAPFIMLTIGLFIAAIILLTGNVLASRTSNQVMYQAQDALDVIERDIRLSGAFLPQNNFAVATPQGSGNNATRFNSIVSGRDNLVLNVIATNRAPESTSRSPVYRANAPHACNSPHVQQNQVLTVNYVYFVSNDSLWRRTVVPPDYRNDNYCLSGRPYQLPSCQPGRTNAICSIDDTELISGVDSVQFGVQYYNSASDTSPNNSARNTNITTRTNAMQSVNVAEVTISIETRVAGRSVEYTGSVRAARIGSLINY